MKTYKQMLSEAKPYWPHTPVDPKSETLSKAAALLKRHGIKAEVVDTGGGIQCIYVDQYGHYMFGTGSGVWGYDFYINDPFDPKTGDPKAGKDIGVPADASAKEVATGIIKTLNAHRGIKESADKPNIQMFRIGNKYEVSVNGELHSTHSSLDDAKRAVKNLKWNDKNQTKEPFINAAKPKNESVIGRKQPNLPRLDSGELESYAWPGGYALAYVTADGGILCPPCARLAEKEGLTNDPDDKQWHIVGVESAANLEPEDAEEMMCDHCNKNVDVALRDKGEENA